MAKKAGKKTQSNRSNKTRRNVRNRKNTKKQKRRTNKQNRKKRATRKRHGVKRGGAASAPAAAAEEPAPAPAAEERKLPAMVSQKGSFVERMAHHLNESEIYECVTIIFQQGLEYNKEYNPMILAVGAAMENGIKELHKQKGDNKLKSLIEEEYANTELKLLALEGEKYFDENILQPKLQNFYDLGTLLQSFSTKENEDEIIRLFQDRPTFKQMVLQMIPFRSPQKDATKELGVKIIENICILIQGLPPRVQISEHGVTIYNRITNRISNIYNDLAKVVSIVYDKDPTIVLTLIDFIITEELVIKTLAQNTDFFPVNRKRQATTYRDLFNNVFGISQYPNIEGTELMKIDFSRLLFHGEPLKPLELDKILEEKNIWWVNDNLSEEKKGWMSEIIPEFSEMNDRTILFNALLRIISDIISGEGDESINKTTFFDIYNIFMDMHTILKKEIGVMGTNAIRRISATTWGDMKNSIITAIDNAKEEIIDASKFKSIEHGFKNRIMTSIDKVIHELVARYVYVDIKIKNHGVLESENVYKERKNILEPLLEKETPEVLEHRMSMLSRLQENAETRDRHGKKRALNMTEKTLDESEKRKIFYDFQEKPWYETKPQDEWWGLGTPINRGSFDKREEKLRKNARKRAEKEANKQKAAENIARLLKEGVPPTKQSSEF